MGLTILCQCVLTFTCVSLNIPTANAIETMDSLRVSMRDGPVQGYLRKSYDNKTFTAFEGIPYAKPPVDSLRFQSPEKPDPWINHLHANKTYICTQFLPIQILGDGMIGQEDCLYMNVYVPGSVINPDTKYEVIVHIHGGAFILGAPRLMAGPKYIMNHEDIIYVSFNYRLGIFGFLSTSDQIISGNFGLKDQNLALRWIKENIGKFGGNPSSITLTGQSAGGASVHYHVISEKSKGLFDKAVMMSGTALNPWALSKNPLQKAKKLGTIFNCSTITSQDLLDCLLRVPARDLGKAIKEFFKFNNLFPVTPFGPVVEMPSPDAFLSNSPYHLIMSNQIGSDVPMIVSCVKDEGIIPSGYFATIGEIDNIKHKWFEIMQYGLDLQDTVPPNKWHEVLQKIKDYYYPNNDLSTDNNSNLTQLFSDRLYLISIQKAVNLHLKINRQPIYFYFFDYDSPAFNVFPSVKGVAHCEDLQLMFNLIISPAQLTNEDHEMTHYMTQMLVNFAKTNIPMENWNPMSSTGQLDYLYITNSAENVMNTTTTISENSFFWNRLLCWENV